MRWVSPPESDVAAAAEGEVVEPDVAQEAEPVPHFLEDRTRDVGIETARPLVEGPPRSDCTERDALEELDRALHRQVDHVADARAVHQHREALGLEPLAAAGLAGLLDHELLERRPHRVAGGLAVAPLDVPEHAFPVALVLAPPARPIGLEPEASGRPVEERVLGGFAVLAPRRVEIELERLGQRGSTTLRRYPRRLAPGQDHALEDRDAGIAQHQLGVHLAPGAEPWQSGQAPNGELKENWRGSSSGSDRPHTGQANRSEKTTDCPAAPLPRLSRVATTSTSRPPSSAPSRSNRSAATGPRPEPRAGPPRPRCRGSAAG